jgi:uncharacterized linocin/CFP29 family protein
MTTVTNGLWDDSVWGQINQSVTSTMAGIRVAQKAILATQLPSVTSVPAGMFRTKAMQIDEGITKPYIELSVEFSLTNGQVNEDATGSTAVSLSALAAAKLARAEDSIILTGETIEGVDIESGDDDDDDGLLGLAEKEISIDGGYEDTPTNSGGGIWKAVNLAIAWLTENEQAQPFALIADPYAYAEISGTEVNGAPTTSVLAPILTQGIFSSAAMPKHRALLIALAGDPTIIYYSDDPATEPTYQGKGGRYFFRTFERIQCVARDPRAFVTLDFGRATTASEPVPPEIAVDVEEQG